MHVASFTQIRRVLRHHLSTLRAERAYEALAAEQPALRAFAGPESFLAWLNASAPEQRDAKDALYRWLIEHHQRAACSLSAHLVLLGLWPGLEQRYRQILRTSAFDPDEVAQELVRSLLSRIGRKSLAGVNRVAASTVLSAARDARAALERQHAQGCDESLDAMLSAAPGSPERVPAALTQPASEAFSGPAAAELVHLLRARFGFAAEVVICRVLIGLSRAETAERLRCPLHQVDRSLARVLATLREPQELDALFPSKSVHAGRV